MEQYGATHGCKLTVATVSAPHSSPVPPTVPHFSLLDIPGIESEGGAHNLRMLREALAAPGAAKVFAIVTLVPDGRQTDCEF